MKSSGLKIVPAVVMAALFTSCASIVSGTTQPIRFTSDPSGADVRIDGINRARTPAEVDVSTKSNHVVLIELPGYLPYQTELHRKMNGWIFGNIFFGGLIGVIVDSSTGAMYGLTPNQVNARLNPLPSKARNRSTQLGPKTIYVATVLRADPSWKKIGQLTPQ